MLQFVYWPTRSFALKARLELANVSRQVAGVEREICSFFAERHRDEAAFRFILVARITAKLKSTHFERARARSFPCAPISQIDDFLSGVRFVAAEARAGAAYEIMRAVAVARRKILQ